MLLNLVKVTETWMNFRNHGDGPGPWSFGMGENSIIESTVLHSISRSVKDSAILLHGHPPDMGKLSRLLREGYHRAHFANIASESQSEVQNTGKYWIRDGYIYILPEDRNAVQIACEATSEVNGPDIYRYVVAGLLRRTEDYYSSRFRFTPEHTGLVIVRHCV